MFGSYRLKIPFVIPTTLTAISMCLSFTALRFAFFHQWKQVVALLILASFCDGLDGYMARRLRATSSFGEVLDSLSDFLTHCIVPIFTVYLWSLHNFGGLGWTVSLFFLLCGGFRLARFNAFMFAQKPNHIKSYQGISTFVASFSVLLPLILSFTNIAAPREITLLLPVFSAILMVSNIPTFGFKKCWLIVNLTLFFVLVLAQSLGVFWLAIAIAVVLYWCSIPVSCLKIKAPKRPTDHDGVANGT